MPFLQLPQYLSTGEMNSSVNLIHFWDRDPGLRYDGTAPLERTRLMGTRIYLLGEAQRCRRGAARCDGKEREALLRLAEGYEREAAKLEPEPTPINPRPS